MNMELKNELVRRSYGKSMPAELVPLLQPARPATSGASEQWLQLERRGGAGRNSQASRSCSLCEPIYTLPLTSAQRAQRWLFGPRGMEYFLRWDGAPTRAALSEALNRRAASTVRLCYGPSLEKKCGSSSRNSGDGRPCVGRATVAKSETAKREAEGHEPPQPREKKTKASSEHN
eukprot:COSAG02_NODE_6578_length_3482_cov_5.503104_4_plen_175_part_00